MRAGSSDPEPSRPAARHVRGRRWYRRLLPMLIVALIPWPVGLAAAGGTRQAQAARSGVTGPADVWWALRLVAEVAPQDNVYATDPTIVRWAGVRGATRAVARSVCSTFVDRVVEQAYGLSATYVTRWLGVYARTIHRAIARQRGFIPITRVGAIAPGDILAIAYYDDDRPSTGHVVIVASAPRRLPAVAPVILGTVQYGVTVIDSAMSGHGPTDSRAESGGHWHTGLGRGVFRLYAGTDGHIAGYSWSATPGSRFYPPAVRNLLVGRLETPPRDAAQPQR